MKKRDTDISDSDIASFTDLDNILEDNLKRAIESADDDGFGTVPDASPMVFNELRQRGYFSSVDYDLSRNATYQLTYRGLTYFDVKEVRDNGRRSPTRISNKVFETPTETYTRVTNLGNGGAGNVYEVEASDGQHYALKVLNRESAGISLKTKRFLRETAFLRTTGLDCVVHAVDVGFIGTGNVKQPFYVMELLDGSMASLMANSEVNNANTLLPMFLDLLNRLKSFYAAGNVHRDIKPQNILYSEQAHRLLLADFGTAHLVGDYPGATVVTKPGERLANYKYAAPEQKGKGSDVDQRADIYAFGLILNEMFTGVVPQGTNYRKIGEVSQSYAYLDDVVDRMISQNPADRHASIDEVLVDIEARSREQEAIATLRIAEVQELVCDDGSRSIVSYKWEDDAIVFTLDQVPDYDWLRMFRSYQENWFVTDGFKFLTRVFPTVGRTITVPRVGLGEDRMKKVVVSMSSAVRWTNENLMIERANEARIAHKEAVEHERKRLESIKRGAEANETLARIVAEL